MISVTTHAILHLLFNALGGLVWAMLFGLGGYLLGDTVHRLTGPFTITTIVLAALVMIVFLVFVRRNEQRLEAEAERGLSRGHLTQTSRRNAGNRHL